MDPALILQAVSTAAIVGSVLFAGLQVRNAQRQRSKDAQMVLANSFANAEFMRAMRLLLSLPTGLSGADLRARVGSDESSVYYWVGAMESLGLLVFNRSVPLDIVDQAYSGPILRSWAVLEVYVSEERARLGRESMHEWFQWLVERLQAYESMRPKIAAQVQHRDWKP